MAWHRRCDSAQGVRLRLGLILIALAAGGLSCSETHQPIDWRQAVRGGLGTTDSLRADTLVASGASVPVDLSTGLTSSLFVGRTSRDEADLEARAFVRWDLGAVPEGVITSAHLEIHLADLREGDPAGGALLLRLYEVESAWTEDSLTLEPAPQVDLGQPLGSAEIDTAGLAATGNVLLLPELFAGEDLAELVEAWRANAADNHGVMLRASTSSEVGILEIYSSEGIPPDSVSTFATPLLVLEVEGQSAPYSIEAAEDAYRLEVTGGELALPDSLLLISAGIVRQTLLKFDLAPLLGEDGEWVAGVDPPELAILRGALRLHPETGSDWSLPADQSVSVYVWEADIDWAAADPGATIDYLDQIDGVTVTGEDTTIVLGIGEHLQHLVEGSQRSLVLRFGLQVSDISSLLLKGPQAMAGRPELEIVYARLSDRIEE